MVPMVLVTKSIGGFLKALQANLATYGAIIISLVGVAMLIVGIYQVAKNLISHGKGQTNWVVTFALIIVGGAFAVSGGWKMLGHFASMGKDTMDKMGQGQEEADPGAVDPFGSGASVNKNAGT